MTESNKVFFSLSWLLTFYSSCKSSSEGMQISSLNRLFLKTLQIIFNINLGQTLFAFSNTSQKKKTSKLWFSHSLVREYISASGNSISNNKFFLSPA